jgi:2-hydroxycyclohexanecarboxyl-CoA dehydrogenase
MTDKRVAIVTGGASGIGLGISKSLAASGHLVAMLDIDAEALQREGAALTAGGARVLARKVDVSDRGQIDAVYTEVRKQFGPISIVIANAGISKAQSFLSMSIEDWQHMIDVNLTGVFHTIQAAVADMVLQKWGRIVTISSNAAQVGAPDRAHYAAAKGGVIGLTKALAREFAAHGITANTIPPALVDTPLARRGAASGEVPPLDVIAQHVPIPRAGTPADIAHACEFLCSDKAGYITGQQINVNGGMYM